MLQRYKAVQRGEPGSPAFLDYNPPLVSPLISDRRRGQQSPKSSLGTVGGNLDRELIKKKRDLEGSKFLLISKAKRKKGENTVQSCYRNGREVKRGQRKQ